jgi:hypothetical protein
MESKIGDQVALLLGLAPTGMPRNRKGINSTPQCKKDDEAHKNTIKFALKEINIQYPDTISKLRNIVFIVQRLSKLPSPTIIVLSANWRV